MKFERSGGILLHPTSLPSPYGIGDLGPGAFRWVDWLTAASCKLWQILPLGPTGYGDSPYQCFSAFAGNPYLISPDLLLEDGLLKHDDLEDMPRWDPRHVDFGFLYRWKPALIDKAFNRFCERHIEKNEFESFKAENANWLHDFALFMALKATYGGGAWDGWPAELRQRDPIAMKEARKSLEDEIQRISFFQYLFFKQWYALKAYANAHGLKIIGDIPIFVAMDSSDVWANPGLFHLGDDLKPLVVAGVPPDYFSPTGQLWGNPLYRWDRHKSDGYAWWQDRIRFTLKTVDIVRIDHFRGFAGYWEIPGDAPTAEKGRWMPGPGANFFEVVKSAFGDLPIIAEDLGEITPDVIALRDSFDLPGMKILQFAFTGPDNDFLPHRYSRNSVVYTGTHDNDTARGWFESAPETEKDFSRRYLGRDWQNGSEFSWDLIRTAWGSLSNFALAPMQDFLLLGTEARFNYPSKLGGNWDWRMVETDISEELKDRINELNWLYQR
jgi:4-alpha-glucanotransferase